MWGAGSGFAARFVLPDARLGVIVTVLAGLGGCLLAYGVAHELLRMHEFHLFEPESLLPAATGSLLLLVAFRRARRGADRRTLFGAR